MSHPKLNERLREVDAHLANLRLQRRRMVVATRRLAACPDSGASCRSECMLLGERSRMCQTQNETDGGAR